MRIISKYKDYYDYFQGIFGIDYTKVYTRKNIIRKKDLYFIENQIYTIKFAIANVLYTMYYYNGNFYHTQEETDKMFSLYKKDYLRLNNRTVYLGKKDFKEENNKSITINSELRVPVLMKINNREWVEPLLGSFDFHRVVNDKNLYVIVETFMGWLVDNPPLPDNQDNTNKITSHGFDLKESFRHRK